MLQPQEILGSYRIIRFLGAGGMGSVYEVEHTAMGTRHALKVLGDHHFHSPGVRERFKREAELMFRLGEHPHIARATDVIDQPHSLALVLDLVEGGDLAQALETRPGPLPWPQVWRILQPVVEAVAFAHQNGVVHRDLKPENILLRSTGTWPGTPLVADFGIAKVLGSDGATRTQARMGTACYSSPEQFKNARDVGPEADVWALGMLAWRLVMGRLPMDPESQDQLYRLYNGLLQVPRLAGVPAPVAEAVAAALLVHAGQRPRDASVLAKLLSVESAPVPAPAVPVAPSPGPVKANVGPWLFLGLALVAAAVVYVGTRAQPAPAPAEKPVVKAEPVRPTVRVPLATPVATRGGSVPPVAPPATPAAPAPTPPEGMIYLHPGTFDMGSESGDADEKPVHKVTLTKGFYLDKTEVTVAAYRACVAAGNCSEPDTGKYCNWKKPGREDHPVNCVDWNQATAYCTRESKQLPTEAQWEYAARSGGKPGYNYPWGSADATCTRAVMNEAGYGCGQASTWPVCSKTAGNSAQEVCDLAGNVYEWVADAKAPYAADAITDPSVTSGPSRVLRGGACSSSHGYSLRAANRFDYAPVTRYDGIGFRCSMTP